MLNPGDTIYRKTQNAHWAEIGRIVPVVKDNVKYSAEVQKAERYRQWIKCKCRVLKVISKNINIEKKNDEKIIDRIPMPKHLIPAVDPSLVFMQQVDGKGMEPLIHDKDYIICIRTDILKDGDICILKRIKDGENFVIRYYRELPKGHFYENAKKQVFNHKYWKVVGKVAGVYHKICFR